MSTGISTNTSAADVANGLAALVHGTGRRLKRMLASATPVAYPGQSDTGAHYAEVYLTWYFGRGSAMWRARFDSEVQAEAAAKEHAKFLDSVLPTHYWAEDWRGRRYKERHEYGISWGVGEAVSREAKDLTPVWRIALPGQERS